MTSPNISLSYQARREVLASFLPRYRAASLAQKSLLLDAFVRITGYARKSAIRLLNHPPTSTGPIQRPRLPMYGPEVQQALFLAWRVAHFICAKRLIPFLPTLIDFLERAGHLQLRKESRTHLLRMSVTTAERLLRTQRKPAPRGLSTTKAGPLLKQQIPMRTFEQWDEARPGFLEADLVAHCGGWVEGNFLYTLTLTDIATGWTECLPLLFRSPEAVQAALTRARALFPFPVLGIDTDNGKEFINAAMVVYCEREQLTFTRGRPEVKNDQCFVEQKNGAIVRSFVGHDRLSGEQAYRQLLELYYALRLYINCFQPSMKLQAKEHDGDQVRRIYDPARTPLQRLLLSGVLSDVQQQELREVTLAFDPLRLLAHLEDLQRALWCGAGKASTTTFLPFSSARCLAGSQSTPASEPAKPATEPNALFPIRRDEVLDGKDFLDGRPTTTRDPFKGTWEHILSLVLTHPEWSSGELFQEIERLFPDCHRRAHLGTLQRRLRQIRAHLLDLREEPWPDALIQRRLPGAILPEREQGGEEVSRPAGTPVSLPSSVAASPFSHPVEVRTIQCQPPVGEEEQDIRTSAGGVAEMPASWPEEALSPMHQTVSGAIQMYLQDLMVSGRRPKTLEWHQTALHLFEQYLVTQRHCLLLTQLTEVAVGDWLAHLRTTFTTRGTLRSSTTIATYARSARAFCSWAARQRYLKSIPFAHGTIPRGSKKVIRLLASEEFDRLLWACPTMRSSDEQQDWATARNRALLWVLLDTGIRVEELCELRLEDVDREHGKLLIRGKPARERQLPLSPQGWHQLLFYLDQHRCGGEGGDAEEEHLFLTETYRPLTKNALTLLFARLRTRAGLTNQSVSPSVLRDTCAVWYLQAGGNREGLGDLLGLRDLAALKRYEDLKFLSSKTEASKESAEVQPSTSGTGPQGSRRPRSSVKKRPQQRSGAGISESCSQKGADEPCRK